MTVSEGIEKPTPSLPPDWDRMDELTRMVQEKIQASGIADTASHTWQNVVEKGRNVASMGRRRMNESMEAVRNRFNESIEDEELSER